MSDNWIRVIPREPTFVPTASAMADAKTYFAQIAPHADEISSELEFEIQFRDCGGNLESIRCPACHSILPIGWWHDQLDEAWERGFHLRPIVTPCGHDVKSLNELSHDFEQGFSQFVVEAMNPGIGELEPAQISRFEEILGCPVKIIYRHL